MDSCSFAQGGPHSDASPSRDCQYLKRPLNSRSLSFVHKKCLCVLYLLHIKMVFFILGMDPEMPHVHTHNVLTLITKLSLFLKKPSAILRLCGHLTLALVSSIIHALLPTEMMPVRGHLFKSVCSERCGCIEPIQE